MGTSTSPAQLARKFDRLAKDLNNPKVPLNATALHVKRIMESTAAGAGALGRKPSGKRKPIAVRYNLRDGKNGALAVISYTGPAHLINNPTRQHFIAASAFGSRSALSAAGEGIGAVTAFGGSGRGMLTGLSQKGRRRNRGPGKRALTIAGDLRPYAFHPGTPGKDFFQKARVIAMQSAPRVYAKAGLTAPLKRAFAA